MSSLSQALSIALTGLQASTGQIGVTANNISNAQTPGYTSKTVGQASVDFQGQFGGVQLGTYSRATDSALIKNLNNATTTAAFTSTQDDYMKQVQTILGSNADTPELTSDIVAFQSAWEQFASNPESTIQQQNVINTAQTLCNEIKSVSSQMGKLEAQVRSDIGDQVTTLNQYLDQMAQINVQIQTAAASSLPTVDLQDKQDDLLNKISAFTNVTTQPRLNGQIAIYTPGGQLLIDGLQAQHFSWDGTAIHNSAGNDVTSVFTGGSMQAATDFINKTTAAASSSTPGVGVIAKFQAQMSKLVDAFTASSSGSQSDFADAYTAAVTASTATGATQAGSSVASSFFTVSNGANGQPDPSSLALNAGLVAGTANLPRTKSEGIAGSFNSAKNYSAAGLNAQSVTYAGLTSAILSSFQQTANVVSAQNDTATTQQEYYKQTLTNKTGVNIDTELSNLISFQNSYAASAHVLTTVNQMLTTLMQAV
jgi:flagellar hook-associated protein 1 FlgK